MNENNRTEKGWKPIPLSLKILFVVFVLWAIGSVFAISERSESGLPFFGMYLYGSYASLIVLLLDVMAPLTFLFALWNRKSWGVSFALTYIAVFILNGVVAYFTVREQLGIPQILIPSIVNVIFLLVIYKTRSYTK
ncbi:hypothetical protein E3V55_06455 [Candidatus Marinimicrobia bacterium MT.SAG.3]|nr:hypothetical protein E3V55_06455 [Candidatus Marinimicrobia bacterium MT.SAG.3]